MLKNCKRWKNFFILEAANYSDSFFYNSSVFNYPTINDQKRLAKTIADTLEGSNPATSKYHKKKELIRNQLGSKDYESDISESALYNLEGIFLVKVLSKRFFFHPLTKW